MIHQGFLLPKVPVPRKRDKAFPSMSVNLPDLRYVYSQTSSATGEYALAGHHRAVRYEASVMPGPAASSFSIGAQGSYPSIFHGQGMGDEVIQQLYLHKSCQSYNGAMGYSKCRGSFPNWRDIKAFARKGKGRPYFLQTEKAFRKQPSVGASAAVTVP